MPLIAYPPNVFFGAILRWETLDKTADGIDFRIVCETAHAPGVMGFALAGIGMAWLPASLVASHLASGALAVLTPLLPGVPLDIVAARPASGTLPASDRFWTRLCDLKTGWAMRDGAGPIRSTSGPTAGSAA